MVVGLFCISVVCMVGMCCLFMFGSGVVLACIDYREVIGGYGFF